MRKRGDGVAFGGKGNSCAALLLAASSLALSSAAWAQSADVETVVVTGTLIPTGAAETISPVAQVSQETIRQQGTTRIEDLLNQMPQVYTAASSATSPGSTATAGTATVNLRNLGAQRTLVLVNGRRLMPGDPLTGQAADLDNIPAILVDHIDVVTGGASATYGSDAVAGVVNFVMKNNLEGLHLDVQYSGYQNDNGNTAARAALASAGLAAPASSVWDGGTLDANAALGLNSGNGKGNITLYAGYRKANAVYAQRRDYSSCQLSSGASFGCVLGSVTSPATFQSISSSGAVTGTYMLDPATGNTMIPFNTKYGYNGAQNNLQRPATRIIGGAYGTYELGAHTEFYAELMGMDNQSYFYQTPAGTYGATFSLSCSNPLLTAQEEGVLCGASPNTATVNFKLSQRNLSGGPRIDDVRNDSYRFVAGLRGEIADGWHYDVYASDGTTLYSESLLNSISTARIQNAINVVKNGSGTNVCAVALSGADTKCVPYNIFQAGGITQQATNYIEVPATSSGSTAEQVVNATVTKDLGDYGIASPYSGRGVSIALGSQYRLERLSFRPDQEYQSGDLTGAGTLLPVSGKFDVYEFYGEVSAPLAQGLPGIANFSINGGYRYSHYSSSGGTDTYKFGSEWSPVEDIRFRASYQQAVRAPSVVELYSGQRLTLFGGNDPCAGSTPTATLAQCQNTGLSASLYGQVPAQNNQNPNSLSGGNPNLKPEQSNTKSFGVAVTPSWVPGLTLSADYFNIGISDVIGTISPTLALTQCAATGNATYCGLIHRAPGSGVIVNDVNGYVVATNVNLGALSTSGIDFQASYILDIGQLTGGGDLGAVTLNLFGTYLDKYKVQPISGLGSYDCEGFFGPTCGQPLPTWRHQMRATWATPWYGVSLGVVWRHTNGVALEKTSSSSYLAGAVPLTDAHIGNVDYIDLSVSDALTDELTVRAGINNLFDRDPPLIGTTNISAPGGNNTYGGMYDLMGRTLFVSVSAAL